MIGRGATNQKGPEATFLAALHALKAAGRKPPVNIVLVAEGEEEIASPHFSQVVHQPEVLKALAKCHEVFMPFASQSPQGSVQIALGAKGVVEVELVASTGKWGRGSKDDIHSSYKAELDSAVWHMVKALSTLVSEDGNDPAIDGWFEHVKPLTARQKELIAEQVAHPTRQMSKSCSVFSTGYAIFLSRRARAARLAANRQYRRHVRRLHRPGGEDILPSKATAKLDFRLVPDQTAADCEAKLKAHSPSALRRYRGRPAAATIPRTTDGFIADQGIDGGLQTARHAGELIAAPRRILAGLYFHRTARSLPAGHFGTGHGSLHTPDEYYVISRAIRR